MAHIYDLLVVTGPTASGKTSIAAAVADRLGGEVVSADSRQVYRDMDIGTGKDYLDYMVDGRLVPFHMVDIIDAGSRYNVFEYQRDFLRVYEDLKGRGIVPVVCGGSGMYLDSIVSGYRLLPVPVNEELRQELSGLSLDKLREILSGYKKLHNESDVDNKKRALRAIEIEAYYAGRSPEEVSFPVIKPLITAILYDRNERRRRITERLKQRLKEGMIEEVEHLLASGVPEETLLYYGLEYKFVTKYLTDSMSYEEMFCGLEISIHQFAKRQMTWFRGMERRGIKIHWIDGELSSDEKVDTIIKLFEQ